MFLEDAALIHCVHVPFKPLFYWFPVLNCFPPQPVLLSFDAEVQKMTSLTEENEQLRQMVRIKS